MEPYQPLTKLDRCFVDTESMMVSLFRRHSDHATRYISVTDRQGNLFGYPTLTVTTGNNFMVMKERHHTYRTEAELQQELHKMLERWLSQGYTILYSYFRTGQCTELRDHLRLDQPQADLRQA